MDIADQWRERVLTFYNRSGANIKPSNNSEWNQLVMQLPTGVYAMQKLAEIKGPPEGGGGGEGDGEDSAADYKVMETDISLQEYIQESFFNTLKEPLELPIFNLPVYLLKKRLEKLEGWADWMTLKGYLSQSGLMPFVVFKNIPKNIPNVGTCYLCDIRVGWVE